MNIAVGSILIGAGCYIAMTVASPIGLIVGFLLGFAGGYILASSD